jgi:hypothetical protein
MNSNGDLLVRNRAITARDWSLAIQRDEESENTGRIDPHVQAMLDALSVRIGEAQWGAMRSSAHRGTGWTYSVELPMYRPSRATREGNGEITVAMPASDRLTAQDAVDTQRAVIDQIVRRARQTPATLLGIQSVEGSSTFHVERSVRDLTNSYTYCQPVRHVVVSGFGTPNGIVTAAARAQAASLQTVAMRTITENIRARAIHSLFRIGAAGSERWVATMNHETTGRPVAVVMLSEDARSIQMSQAADSQETVERALGRMILSLQRTANSD